MKIFSFGKKKEEIKKTETPVTADNKLTGAKKFVEGLVSTKDIIAPAALEVDFNHIRIGNRYYRTLFVAGYPRFVGINWLSPLVNFDASLNVSMYIYPTDGKEILDDLRRKIAEMEAEINTDLQRGRVVNPATQAKLEDALNLQAELVRGEERFFQFGLYVTISTDSEEELDRINKNIEAALGSLMIISKRATLQMEDGFVTTLPLCIDRLGITRNMDTTSLATTFPFVSSDLSDDKGIMYGINEHNGSLVIFDRFSMPNYNSVVFATAGAGKSYLIKLEAIRSLMMGTEIIVIDPENEYRNLSDAVGGQYIAFGYGEESKINPFDLSLTEEEGENALNAKMLNLHGLLKVMLGEMNPMEESIMDKALMEAYKAKGITPDPTTQNKEPPLIEDLYKSLMGMEDKSAQTLAARMEKYIKGSFAGIFNQKTTVNLKNKMVVFGIRNLEEALRPIAMHIILDYIWTVVKKTLKKRIMIVDEAWYLMQFPDSAAFLRGIVKRSRKYYLGVTTITQDVDDFLKTPYGKEIVTNSAIQILLKQHSAAIDQIGEVFYLSEGEKQLLLTADKGEGIFFAGQNHVAIRVIASADEHKLITSNPEEVMQMKKTVEEKKKEPEKPMTVAEPPKPILVNKPITENSNQVVEIESGPVLNAISPKVEDVLQKRIKEMEEQEKKEIEEHRKEVEVEEKEKESKNQSLGGFGSLPKYQDLFKPTANKLPPLPPLPPLPKYEPVIKPIFITPEPKIPQPPQLVKKNKPEFVAPEQNKTVASQAPADKKTGLTYDKLFGDGIV
ncbi:MAG: ATP-binding protein [Candidatus Shapirobacteria bacterium]